LSLRTLKLVLGVVIAGFILAAVYISAVVFERQHALRRISRYNPTWQASQTLLEFMRLQQCLLEFQASGGATDRERLLLRYEILVGAATQLSQGTFQAVVARHPELEGNVRDVGRALAAVEPLLADLQKPGVVEEALHIVRPIQGRLREFLSAIYNDGAELTSEDEKELTRLHWIFSGLAGSLIFFGVLLIALLGRHNRLLGRAHRQMHGLAADLSHLAHHDALTGLANRVLFRSHLEQALDQARRDGVAVAVLYLDLDLFKNVNDALGHETGDLLLKTVAARLRGCVQDGSIIARLGGDEFAVLPPPIRVPQECAVLASRIVREVGAPYDIDGHEIIIGTSIGIALSDAGPAAADQLMKHADMALYRAKADGRATFRFFEPEMDVQLQARRALEADLRRALANDEFELHYQPQVDLRSNEVSGFEALLRWRHPDRGMVSPAEFIPVAEDIGLIVPLGEWVLNEACTTAAAWPRDTKVAVNLSPVQFRNGALVRSVRKALAGAGLAASRLELELTETALFQENEATLETLHQLRALGVRIALDDFGTGYSSLSYLRSFPFDKIKIDQSFVRELSTRPDCLVIVRSIVGLGAGLKMSITAEGVETEDQLLQVRAAGCTEVQGYYFGRPEPDPGLSSSPAPLACGAA
jgi:diguanylate cyclase (GGDEF)-like protein